MILPNDRRTCVTTDISDSFSLKPHGNQDPLYVISQIPLYCDRRPFSSERSISSDLARMMKTTFWSVRWSNPRDQFFGKKPPYRSIECDQ